MWIGQQELLDVITIAEITPGPFGLNASTFVGVKLAGVLGALCAVLGFITVPVCITAILGRLYFSFNKSRAAQGILAVLKPAVAGLIASAAAMIMSASFWGENGASFDIGAVNLFAVCVCFIGFAAMRRFKANPILVILVSGIVGAMLY